MIFCRICWNSRGWTSPSGDAASLEGKPSYVAKCGFGHEEWLFDFEMVDPDGNKFAFLQPFAKGKRYQGKTKDIALYTKAPDGYHWVALLQGCYVLNDTEQEAALGIASEYGWESRMRADVEHLGISPRETVGSFNVKFRKEHVTFFEPLRPIAPEWTYNRRRYQAYLDGNLNIEEMCQLASFRRKRRGTRKPKSTEPVARTITPSNQQSTMLHNKIQNGLLAYLQERHGRTSTILEKNDVDVTLSVGNDITYCRTNLLSICRRWFESMLNWR